MRKWWWIFIIFVTVPRVRGLGRWYETSIILWLSDQAPRCVKCWRGGYIIHKSKLGTARNCALLPVGFNKQMFLRSIIYIIADWCNYFFCTIDVDDNKQFDEPQWQRGWLSTIMEVTSSILFWLSILTPVARMSVTLPIRAEKIGLGFLTVKDYNI